MERLPRFQGWTLLPGILLLAASAGIFATRAFSGQEQLPLNAQLTKAAWDAFNKGDYEEAIAKATECIDEFVGAANREQAELEEQGTPLPPKGRVSEEEQEIIFARGLLNDVATSFFIIGRSAERLGRIEDAKEAYRRATEYTYARTWDPKGWFWSPAEAASDRLSVLR